MVTARLSLGESRLHRPQRFELFLFLFSTPGGTRTPNLLIRSQNKPIPACTCSSPIVPLSWGNRVAASWLVPPRTSMSQGFGYQGLSEIRLARRHEAPIRQLRQQALGGPGRDHVQDRGVGLGRRQCVELVWSSAWPGFTQETVGEVPEGFGRETVGITLRGRSRTRRMRSLTASGHSINGKVVRRRQPRHHLTSFQARHRTQPRHCLWQ